MASSIFAVTVGRPSFLPCWRTRSRPAGTLLRRIAVLLAEHRRDLDHGTSHRLFMVAVE